MRVLGIVGSPREGGNTEIMMAEALASAKESGAEVEMMTLAGKQISGCQGCQSCKKTGKCVIDDDMQMFYSKLVEADAIILGSPVYFWGITGQMKVFMDRTGPLSGAHGAIFKDGQTSFKCQTEGLRNKIGGIIVVTRRAGATSVFAQIRAFFRIHNMVECGGAIGYGGDKGEVHNDEQGMREAKYVGRAMVRAYHRMNP